jgi:hypothetical protein
MEKEEFIAQIRGVVKRVEQLEDSIKTEEATKTSLIMPFFQALGYDVFNPLEFIPEYVADVGIKKGEKVDYAVVINGELTILVEAKTIAENLDNHDSQLFRYFGTTTAKFGILTNGKVYRFFTDLDHENKMDSSPFLQIDITNLRESQMNELFRFAKDNFDVDKISSTASELKYITKFRDYLSKELKSPDEEFVKFVMGYIYDGRKTQQTVEKFTPIIVQGFSQMITEQVNDKLASALNSSVSGGTAKSRDTDQVAEENEEEPISDADNEIITTPAEFESFTTAKIILRGLIDEDRIYYRDNRSYFNVLLDDNRRKWIFRVFFTKSRNWIILHDDDNTQLDFVNPIDIYQYADKIKSVVAELDDDTPALASDGQ